VKITIHRGTSCHTNACGTIGLFYQARRDGMTKNIKKTSGVIFKI
jgi:hypothetical protein